MYDLIIVNNASKVFTLVQGLENIAPHHLYFEFENVELDVQEGEYTYVLIANDREDVVYDYRLPVLDTIVKTDEGNVQLRDLRPNIGLLRVGLQTVSNEYDTTPENNNGFVYYED